jgi:hypothetical protein
MRGGGDLMDRIPTVQERVAMARDFLEGLWPDELPDGGLVTLWSDTSSPAAQYDDIGDAASAVARGVRKYFNVAAVRPLSGFSRGKRSDVVALPGFFADIDLAGGAHAKQALPTIEIALDLLTQLPLQPTVIVHSGGGLYAHWLFKEAWVFENDKERRDAAALSKGWQDRVKALWNQHGYHLDSTADLPRVLRCPGALNEKYTPARLVRVIGGSGAPLVN